MESNFFRLFARELAAELAGARIDKIFSPAPDVWTLALSGSRGRAHLLFRFGPRHPLLFLCRDKPPNPESPAAQAMWLRRRAAGRRLLEQAVDWAGRRIAWRLSGPEGGWLLLDLRQGPRLEPELAPGFADEPDWPELDAVLTDENLWRTHPQLSPALRAGLERMEPGERQVLYGALQRGEGKGIWVRLAGGEPVEALPWALAPSPNEEVRWFVSALEAASFYGERLLFPPLAGEEAEAVRARMRRVRKTLHRLEREEAALREKADLRNTALALQAALYRLETTAKLHEVDLGPAGERVELDPSLSVVQNMERWFRLAAKAERGLGAVRQRRELLEEELAGLAAGMRVPEPRASRPKAVTRGKASRPELPVHRFRTADGFLVLRGKNAAANHRLVTRAAAPFDLWFHAADGPGAHCVLKRDHPAQEVPERSLVQAAVLAGLKSWQSEGGKAEVLCALVRDVRAVKGAAMGQVVVDAVLQSLRVDLDPSLEQKLRID